MVKDQKSLPSAFVHTSLSQDGGCFMEYQQELVHICVPLLEAYRFHFDFAARDMFLPSRFPSNCFYTIEEMVFLCLYT